MNNTPAPSFTPGNRVVPNGAVPSTAAQIRPNIANIGGSPNTPRPAIYSQGISLDDTIRAMLETGDGVSDLLFVVGRLPQVEIFGKLKAVEIADFMPALQPAHTEQLALAMMGDNERLHADLKKNGSCD